MKRFTLFITLFTAIVMTTTSKHTYAQSTPSGRVLVAYFSATGTTRAAAQQVVKATGGELFEIVPQTPYTAADLDWTDKKSRSSVEMNDPTSRPAIASLKSDIANYDTIYLGYPIWWYVAPTIINTFVEAHNLKGKTVVCFATSGGSPIGPAVKALRKTYPDINWLDGALLNRTSDAAVSKWVNSLGK